jgi:2-aminoadipate transaminase
MLPWDVDPAQVLITTGSQQGLDLVAKVLIDEGSRVLVETPTYLGALQAFTPMEPVMVSVASDDEGVDVDDLRPSGHGPTRRPLPLRAAQLPEPHRPHHDRGPPRRAGGRAAELGLPLVEDNPYGDLWFDEPATRCPLTARNRCIYLGSFSKVLAPGLRLGFWWRPRPFTPSCCRPSRRPTCTAPASTSAWWPR